MLRTTPGGQPCYSPLTILAGLTLRVVFRLALRQTMGLIGSIVGLPGLELCVPDHSTLSRRAKTLVAPRLNGEPLLGQIEEPVASFTGDGACDQKGVSAGAVERPSPSNRCRPATRECRAERGEDHAHAT